MPLSLELEQPTTMQCSYSFWLELMERSAQ